MDLQSKVAMAAADVHMYAMYIVLYSVHYTYTWKVRWRTYVQLVQYTTLQRLHCHLKYGCVLYISTVLWIMLCTMYKCTCNSQLTTPLFSNVHKYCQLQCQLTCVPCSWIFYCNLKLNWPLTFLMLQLNYQLTNICTSTVQ